MTHRMRIWVGFILTAIAGWIDGIGFIELGGLYTSFMSGNTTQLGLGIANANWIGAGRAALLLALFLTGSFAGTLLTALLGERWRLTVPLLLEGLLLGLGYFLSTRGPHPLLGTGPLAFAMGLQNAVVPGHGVTFVTGTLYRAGQSLALTLLGRDETGAWRVNLLTWLAMAVGAIGGGLLHNQVGLAALTPAAFMLILLAGSDQLGMLRQSRRLARRPRMAGEGG